MPRAPSRLQVAVLLVCLAGSCLAEPNGFDPGKEGRRCLLRSAICPGWGQLVAGSTCKGLLFLSVTAGLAAAHARASDLSRSQRRELNRWTALFWLYNVGDAYVDGYLRSFDEEMRDIEAIGEDLLEAGTSSAWRFRIFCLAW